MATLVLTTAGAVVGGPIGAAVGAFVGKQIDDKLLFPKKGREGPRLTELAVQTSSYGSEIPRLFGTMRIAGTVIWSTDLMETRSTAKAGKGQPGTTTYSYSASFAVLLSGRPIRGVGRIWAEGKLLRGAAGDWKSQTGFRLHQGGEDQPVDPLIASAVGAGLAPAHRGCAYAVFEGMALADFGNRIPSLTFEVEADAGAMSVGAIARELAPEVTGEAAMMLDGFAAGGASMRGVLETLGEIGGAWFAAQGAEVMMRDRAADAVRLSDEGQTNRAIAPLSTVPRAITVGHYDPRRDYQLGMQRASRPGAGWREDAIEVPAAIAAGAARTLAAAMVSRAEAARVRRTVTAPLDALALAPGQCVRIDGDPCDWRIEAVRVEGMVPRLTLAPIAAEAVAVMADGGAVVGAADVTIGATRLAVFETPPLDDAVLAAPRITIAACGAGAGWRQAALLLSRDGGASWEEVGATAAPATIGAVTVAPLAGPRGLIDAAGFLDVALLHADMTLAGADDARLDAGANLALVGDELIQFGVAEPLGETRWRLSRLLRGRRGTERAIATQAAGDRFVLIEAATVRTVDLPLAALGSELLVMASGVGDAEPATARLVVNGSSVVPPAPVLDSVTIGADGAARVRWRRRSRAGWRWLDGGDVPLAEEQESYRIEAVSGNGARLTIESDRPEIELDPALRVSGKVALEIRQRGDLGESVPLSVVIAG